MIAFCGKNCEKCPVYIATQKDDSHLRNKVVSDWAEKYKAIVMPEHVRCNGCSGDSASRFIYCRICEIRKCAIDRQLENCSRCADYPCDNLHELFRQSPQARINLEQLEQPEQA